MAKHRRPRTFHGWRRLRWQRVLLVATITVVAATAMRLASAGTSSDPAQPGHNRAGGPGHAAGTLPAKITGASPSLAPARRVTGRSPAPARQVTGRSVTAIGDSVMVASAPALDQDLPGIYINAVVGRQFATGLQVLASLQRSGQLRQVVVFGLGTNGPVTASEIGQLFAEIGPRRLLVLVNTFADRPWEPAVNTTLAEAALDHPRVVLANWFTAIEHRTNLLWPDGIHPQPAGGILYAQIVTAAVERVASQPS